MTVRQRREVYNEMLTWLLLHKEAGLCVTRQDTPNGLCEALWDYECGMWMMSELSLQKPSSKDFGQYWWPHNKNGLEQRIKAVENAIKLTYKK